MTTAGYSIRQFYDEYLPRVEDSERRNGACEDPNLVNGPMVVVEHWERCCAKCESTKHRCYRRRDRGSFYCDIHRPLCTGKIMHGNLDYDFWYNTAVHGFFDRIVSGGVFTIIQDIYYPYGRLRMRKDAQYQNCIVNELYKYFWENGAVHPTLEVLKVYLAAALLVMLRDKREDACYSYCRRETSNVSMDHETAILLRNEISRAFHQEVGLQRFNDPVMLENMIMIVERPHFYERFLINMSQNQFDMWIGQGQTIEAQEMRELRELVTKLKTYYSPEIDVTRNYCILELKEAERQKALDDERLRQERRELERERRQRRDESYADLRQIRRSPPETSRQLRPPRSMVSRFPRDRPYEDRSRFEPAPPPTYREAYRPPALRNQDYYRPAGRY